MFGCFNLLQNTMSSNLSYIYNMDDSSTKTQMRMN